MSELRTKDKINELAQHTVQSSVILCSKYWFIKFLWTGNQQIEFIRQGTETREWGMKVGVLFSRRNTILMGSEQGI